MANGGNGQVQYLLAYMDLTGRGVPHYYLRAETYFRLASERRNTFGPTLLGELFEHGRVCRRIFRKRCGCMACQRNKGTLMPRTGWRRCMQTAKALMRTR